MEDDFIPSRVDADEEIMEGADEEEEEEEDGEYRLRFETGMDPMEFVEVDAFGLEPYQQFQRLEYEALAERKRKALQSQIKPKPSKKLKEDDVFGAQFDEILESMTHRPRRRSGQPKKRGRRRGSKKNTNPEVTRKLGDATLHYASGQYDEAIGILEEIIRIAPNTPDAYRTLGLIYNDTGDKKKSMNFYMIAAHLKPKDPALWNLLVPWSIEEGNTGLVKYCLSKAITADPEDISLRLSRASLYIGLGDYQKAAESYEQVIALYPANIDVRKMAAKMHKRCGRVDRAIFVLDSYLRDGSFKVDFSIVDLLLSFHMENGGHVEALEVIKHVRALEHLDNDLPRNVLVKEGICQAYLRNMDKAEILLKFLDQDPAEENADLITEVADSFSILGHFELALKFYSMLEGTSRENGSLHFKISQCYLSLKLRTEAIPFLYKVLLSMEDHIDARITLSSILIEEGRDDEATHLLSPPENRESTKLPLPVDPKAWWLDGRIKVALAKTFHQRGMVREFVDCILHSVRESLCVESLNEEVSGRKRLNMRDLHERVKLLEDRDNNIFHGFRPIATSSEMVKATRAKKLLQKRTALREERKARVLASGLEWRSDDSEEESYPKELREPPIPNLLKDEVHYQLIIDLCKALVSLQQYWDALEVMNHTLKFTYKTIPNEKKEELRSIGAQIAYNAADPTHGYDFVRSIVMKHPNSCAAWNFYYKVISRCDSRLPKHVKFLHNMRVLEKTNLVFPMIIYGHQFTMNSQHQDAAREYLEARKLQPDNPLINLCVGTALINLALGFRLKNKHLTVVQGLAFLYEYAHICNNSQEALYNVARALHHVGLVTLAASYYEEVLTMEEIDRPIPRLSYDVSPPPQIKNPGYCSLRREAAYNLHLIYKRSGALDLARQELWRVIEMNLVVYEMSRSQWQVKSFSYPDQ